MNLKINAIALAILAASGDCFVSKPMKQATTVAFRSTRRFATTDVMPPPSDQVQRLKEKAAKLRQEAASLEAEQRSAIKQAAESVFRKFDKDKDGQVSVQELQKGLKQIFKMELSDERANRLVKEFDVNGDGSLQVEEFVGVDKFRNTLDTLVREERDLARQQAKEAQAAAEAAERAKSKMELVNDNAPTTTDKIVSVLPYLFPLLDGLQFARFFIEGNQENPLAIAATMAYILYRSIPLGGLVSFFGLTALSENPKLNRLVRFNSQQAVFLDIFLFAPVVIAGLGAFLLSQAGVTIPPSVFEVGSDAMFLVLLATIGYSTMSSLLGETPNKLPFISKRVEDRMISADMFDENGRFAPFDKDGKLKKPNSDDDETKD